MGIGIPGSGKTTVLKDFAQKYGYSYVCPDDIRFELSRNTKDQTRNREVWDRAYGRVASLISENKNVVFDATFANESDRINFINFARESGAEKIQGIYLDIPLELAKERNSERERVVPEYVLERMNRQLNETPPKIEDGFDTIFTLDEYQKLVEVEKLEGDKLLNKNLKLI